MPYILFFIFSKFVINASNDSEFKLEKKEKCKLNNDLVVLKESLDEFDSEESDDPRYLSKKPPCLDITKDHVSSRVRYFDSFKNNSENIVDKKKFNSLRNPKHLKNKINTTLGGFQVMPNQEKGDISFENHNTKHSVSSRFSKSTSNIPDSFYDDKSKPKLEKTYSNKEINDSNYSLYLDFESNSESKHDDMNERNYRINNQTNKSPSDQTLDNEERMFLIAIESFNRFECNFNRIKTRYAWFFKNNDVNTYQTHIANESAASKPKNNNYLLKKYSKDETTMNSMDNIDILESTLSSFKESDVSKHKDFIQAKDILNEQRMLILTCFHLEKFTENLEYIRKMYEVFLNNNPENIVKKFNLRRITDAISEEKNTLNKTLLKMKKKDSNNKAKIICIQKKYKLKKKTKIESIIRFFKPDCI